MKSQGDEGISPLTIFGPPVFSSVLVVIRQEAVTKNGNETTCDGVEHNDRDQSSQCCYLHSLRLHLTPSYSGSFPSFVTAVWPIASMHWIPRRSKHCDWKSPLTSLISCHQERPTTFLSRTIQEPQPQTGIFQNVWVCVCTCRVYVDSAIYIRRDRKFRVWIARERVSEKENCVGKEWQSKRINHDTICTKFDTTLSDILKYTKFIFWKTKTYMNKFYCIFSNYFLHIISPYPLYHQLHDICTVYVQSIPVHREDLLAVHFIYLKINKKSQFKRIFHLTLFSRYSKFYIGMIVDLIPRISIL